MVEVGMVPDAQLADRVREAVRRMLLTAFDDFTDHDWAHSCGGMRAVVVAEGRPVAHAAVVPRTLEVAGTPYAAGYVEAVATAPEYRGHGLGSAVVSEVARQCREHFDMGALSTSRHRFYERLGWERWRGPSYVREGDQLVRTPEEDDGLMVLRFGPSSAVDLAAPISCRARPGDDW